MLGAAAAPGSPTSVFYTGTDRQAWGVSLSNMAQPVPERLGGRLAGGPAAVWARAGQWTSWHKIGKQLLPGTAPTALYTDRGIFIAAAGTDHAVWGGRRPDGSAGLKWHSIGGRTNSTPALTSPSDGVMVAFLRGTGNVAWYREFLGQTSGVTTGWHSLGGTLTSGVTALTEPVAAIRACSRSASTTGRGPTPAHGPRLAAGNQYQSKADRHTQRPRPRLPRKAGPRRRFENGGAV